MSEQANNPFAYLVAVFLSEVIRSRQTSIKRAAEISGRVVDNIAGIQSEEQALVFVTQLETDFEEVQTLKQALHFGYSASDISVYESEIKEFSAQLFRQDMVQSSQFLQDAVSAGMTIQQLCIKYPAFCNFVLANPEKSWLINGGQAAAAAA